uniref:Uncharacterized protein n=1 Tax=Lactuca sativa TaxID=4236 RepID=A0A9R1X6C1_LACSA|nr:hypothetical protein LSAT_V11C600335670 [Lactuca sativa]
MVRLLYTEKNGKGAKKGYGSIKFNSVVFKNVSYVKGLQHNLISISQLFEVGYEILFNKREGKVVDQKSVTDLTTSQQNDIYVLDMFSTGKNFHCCFFC